MIGRWRELAHLLTGFILVNGGMKEQIRCCRKVRKRASFLGSRTINGCLIEENMVSSQFFLSSSHKNSRPGTSLILF